MLRIRLTRIGRKNRPHYRIVVAEHSSPVKGKFIAILGSYDPRNKKLQLKKDEAKNWMNKGAKPSNTVAKIFTKEGLKHKSIVIVKFHSKPKTEEKPEEKKTAATEPVIAKEEKPVVTEPIVVKEEKKPATPETAPKVTPEPKAETAPKS
jgi:small subunit ribosomal protein S16